MLEYDDVMNKQREIIYGQRKQVLDGMDVKDIIMNMVMTPWMCMSIPIFMNIVCRKLM